MSRAAQLDLEGKCIICGESHKDRRRGLCDKHHGRFMAALRRISPENREAFEAQLIAAGKLLPNRRGQKLRPEDDEFAVELAKFQAGAVVPPPKDKPATAAEIAAEVLAAAKNAQKKAAAERGKKKPNPAPEPSKRA